MKALIIMLIIAGIMAVLILWSALTVPMSEYDRKVDDEAQQEYLKKQMCKKAQNICDSECESCAWCTKRSE